MRCWGYKGFRSQNFQIVAAFDIDPKMVGTTIQDVPVFHLDDLPKIVRERNVKLGMIMVPSPVAQQVADQLVAAGIEGIVNFAPVTLALPPEVSLVGVDLAIELEQLCFNVANRKDKAAE
jgi:redox-sensing transcriptional repressor